MSHPKQAQTANAILVLSPEHYGIFRDAGWDRTRITRELHAALVRPGRDLIAGAQGVGEGIPRKPGRRDGSEILGRWPADRSRRRPGWTVLGHLRRLDRRPRPRSNEAQSPRRYDFESTIDPERPDGGNSPALRPASASASLNGLTVALLDIGKARGDEYVDRLQELFTARGISWRRYKKPTNTRTAPVELLQQIARECQVAVIALSD